MTDHGNHNAAETFSSPSLLPHSFDSLTDSDTNPTFLDGGLSERWHSLSRHLSSQRLSKQSIVAMSRKLDEVEEILVGASAQIPLNEDAQPALGKDQLLVSHEVTDYRARLSPPASHHAAKIIRPSEDASDDSDKDFESLDRYAEAMDQLRQRQRQYEVCRHVSDKMKRIADDVKQLHGIAISRIEDRDRRLIQLGSEMAQMYATSSF
ncbi:MAG: hypothetical protein LQ351_001723 [Letrouitia transgressa]|nr:MAG: hypothetical protein LQ351_001723 [Letrouitia transgressa]